MPSRTIKQPFFQAIAEGIYNEILSQVGRYHFFLGKTLEWDSNDEIEDAESNYLYELEVRNKIITTKQIGISDVAYVIPRINWTPNTVYDMYDDTIDLFNNKQFYVMTQNNLVYKCISNNYDAESTVEPTSTSTDLIKTSDGYIWKFMYAIPAAFENKFMTFDFIPVTNSLREQFYSNGTIIGFTIENEGSGYSSAVAVVSGDGYIEDNPFIIQNISVVDSGMGYVDSLAPPDVTISAPSVISGDEVQATATASMVIESGQEDEIASITITEAGYGYTDDVTATVPDPIGFDLEWSASAAVNPGDIVKNGRYFFEVSFESGVSSGNLGTEEPDHIIGSETNGDAILEVIAITAELKIIGQKTEADIDVVVDNGKVTNLIINDGGVGYSFATIKISGDGEGAVVTTNLSIGDINTLQANIELFAVDGSIDYIKVENGGSGYSEATVTIEGNGSGATAQPIMVDGVITAIEVLDRGNDYNTATVTIDGNGSGATARAIMSPLGGHGFNAITELGTKSLMFFTNISQEKNQSFDVNNDYRQIGIIKALKNFGETSNFRNQIGSACYRVFGDINTNIFTEDKILTDQNDNEFIIVSSKSGELLLQDVSGIAPTVGNILTDESSNSFIIAEINTPTVDKYSGNLLFIENRESFEPSSTQSITIKTVLNL